MSICTFGPFKLTPSERLLEKDGEPVALGSRALDILIALAERPGLVLSHRELSARAWSSTVVEKGALRVAVAGLRKTLGDGINGARYIVNVPGRGYCLVAPVTHLPNEAAQREWKAEIPGQAECRRLPARLARILGRDQTIHELCGLLVRRRFVSVTGPGGIGKTTVAIAMAHAMSAEFGGAVYFVDLGALADPGDVSRATAAALAIPAQAEDPLPSLLSLLQDRRVLLVLDNCEHVIEAAARLAERLYHDAPQVCLLATSREALRFEGEIIHVLAPLCAPPAGAELTAEAAAEFGPQADPRAKLTTHEPGAFTPVEADDPPSRLAPGQCHGSRDSQRLAYPAVQLFIERAMAGSEHFVPGDADMPVIAEICRKLDGLPLAIELAAAAVEPFGVRGLAAHLKDCGLVLPRGRRTAIPRQRTLRAVFDWSYDLLPPTEQAVFRRLSIFRTIFSPDAARRVVAASDVEPSVVFDCVIALAEKSLLVIDVDGDDIRCHLLETARAYGAEKVREHGERNALARRHAEHLLCVLATEHSGRTDVGAEPHASPLSRLADLRCALDWAFSEEGDAGLGARLTAAAVPLWLHLSKVSECRQRIEQAIPTVKAQDPGSLRCLAQLRCALGSVGQLALPNFMGPMQAVAEYDFALAVAEHLDDTHLKLSALWGLWLSNYLCGHNDACLSYAIRFQAEGMRAADDALDLFGVRLIGITQHVMGHHAAARSNFERFLSRALISRAVISRFQYDQSLSARIFHARISWLQGHLSEALGQVERCVEDAVALGHGPTLMFVLGLGGCPISLEIGQLSDAQRMIELLVQKSKTHPGLGYYSNIFRGWLLIRQGDVRQGLEKIELGLMKDLPHDQFNAFYATALMKIAEAACLLGEHDRARDAVDIALGETERGNGNWCLPELLRLKAAIPTADSSRESPASLLSRSLQVAREQGAYYWGLKTATDLARLRQAAGRPDEAAAILRPEVNRFSKEAPARAVLTARELLRELDAEDAASREPAAI